MEVPSNQEKLDALRDRIRRHEARVVESMAEVDVQLTNVLEHCYQYGVLHCSGCAGSIELARDIARRERV